MTLQLLHSEYEENVLFFFISARLIALKSDLAHPQGDNLPPSSTRGQAGRNNLLEEITPLGIGERCSQTI
jgi:hypothetical protein